jgi:hypothetical protein
VSLFRRSSEQLAQTLTISQPNSPTLGLAALRRSVVNGRDFDVTREYAAQYGHRTATTFTEIHFQGLQSSEQELGSTALSAASDQVIALGRTFIPKALQQEAMERWNLRVDLLRESGISIIVDPITEKPDLPPYHVGKALALWSHVANYGDTLGQREAHLIMSDAINVGTKENVYYEEMTVKKLEHGDIESDVRLIVSEAGRLLVANSLD